MYVSSNECWTLLADRQLDTCTGSHIKNIVARTYPARPVALTCLADRARVHCLAVPTFYNANCSNRWQRRWFVLYDDGELTYSLDEHVSTPLNSSPFSFREKNVDCFYMDLVERAIDKGPGPPANPLQYATSTRSPVLRVDGRRRNAAALCKNARRRCAGVTCARAPFRMHALIGSLTLDAEDFVGAGCTDLNEDRPLGETKDAVTSYTNKIPHAGLQVWGHIVRDFDAFCFNRPLGIIKYTSSIFRTNETAYKKLKPHNARYTILGSVALSNCGLDAPLRYQKRTRTTPPLPGACRDISVLCDDSDTPTDNRYRFCNPRVIWFQ
ncbi:Protein outspread [Eumeta japonica]|uniref:Protein outspread n=1 Tax=Eumeta variegata TaxID=151549 RepID=A0A4C1TT84_EUMVA|nr:Protein outspread [Eumeta japonica]